MGNYRSIENDTGYKCPRANICISNIEKRCDPNLTYAHKCDAQKCGIYITGHGETAIMEYYAYCNSIRITYVDRPKKYMWRCCGSNSKKHPVPYCHPYPF